jgi:hypothetical protein
MIAVMYFVNFAVTDHIEKESYPIWVYIVMGFKFNGALSGMAYFSADFEKRLQHKWLSVTFQQLIR